MKLVPLPLPNFYKRQENLKKMSSKRKKSDKKAEKPNEPVVQEVESAEEPNELVAMEPLPKTKMRSFNSIVTMGECRFGLSWLLFVVQFRYQIH